MKLPKDVTIHTNGKRFKNEIPDELYKDIKEKKPVKATDGDKYKKSDGKSS